MQNQQIDWIPTLAGQRPRLGTLRNLVPGRRELARRLLGARAAKELHARRWAHSMGRFADPTKRPFELGLVDRFVGEGQIALDFGAHGGAWSYPLARRVGGSGRVHAFEIFPYYAETLERALALRKVENVEVHRHGLSDTNGNASIVLVDERDTELTGTIRVASGSEAPRKSQSVAVRTFDDVAQQRPELLQASFAKIDVEGSELALFRGASRLLFEARPVIFCEVTRKQCRRNGHTTADVLDFVRAAEYGIYTYGKNTSLRPIPCDERDVSGDFVFLPLERAAAANAA